MVDKRYKYERGQVILAETAQYNHVQGGFRPYLIVQNNIGNKYSPNLILCPITSNLKKQFSKTHVDLTSTFFIQPSTVMCETILPISKEDVSSILGKLSNEEMSLVNNALRIELAL